MALKEPTIRVMPPEMAPLAAEWFLRNKDNSGLEPDMLSYPATRILYAEDPYDRHPWLFVPVHPIYVMDSIAPNPEATGAQIGMALRKVTEIVKWQSAQAGHGQVYFIPSEQNIYDFATKHERFTEIGGKLDVLCLKL